MALPTIQDLWDSVQDLYNLIFNSLPYKQTTFSGTLDPSVNGFSAPIGAFYKQLDGTGKIIATFQKIDNANTAWEAVGSGGGSSGSQRNPKIFSIVASPPAYSYTAMNLDAIHINDNIGTNRSIIFPNSEVNQSIWIYVYAASNAVSNTITLSFSNPVHNNGQDTTVIVDDYGFILLCEYIAAENLWVVSREADIY